MQPFAKGTLFPIAVTILLGMAGCESDRPRQEIVAPAGAIVTPIPEVSEFLEMPGLAGYGFRYSGAPLALSLEIYLQTIAQSDWSDPDKRKEIYRSVPDEEDRKVDWDSIQPDLIDSFEAGTMPVGVKELTVTSPTGKILFTIPRKWYSDPQPGHVGISGEGSSSAKSWLRFGLSKEFRNIDQRSVGTGSSPPRVPTEPISIAHGETAQLVYFSEDVIFGEGQEDQSSVYRIVVELKARCLHPPPAVRPAPAVEENAENE